MFTSVLNERSRSNPLCDFRLGTVVTSDYETPLTEFFMASQVVAAEHCKNYNVAGLSLEFECLDDG